MPWMTNRSRTDEGWYRALRKRILQRDGYICYVCKGPGNIMDHITNVKQGGTNDEGNLACICIDCHKEKTIKEAAYGRSNRPARRRLDYTYKGSRG